MFILRFLRNARTTPAKWKHRLDWLSFRNWWLSNEDGTLAADDGAVNQTQIEALNNGWVSITRPWHLLTKNSGAADPHAATAEKGQKMMEVLVARLGQFLIDLSEKKSQTDFPIDLHAGWGAGKQVHRQSLDRPKRVPCPAVKRKMTTATITLL